MAGKMTFLTKRIRIIRMYLNGIRLKDICKKVGVGERTIHNLMKYHRIPPRRGGGW